MKKLNYFLIILTALGFLTQNVFSQTWTKSITFTGTGIKEIQFPESQTGYIASDSVINKTTDGGEIWLEVPLAPPDREPFSALYFTDADTGFAAAALALYKTENGGDTWTPITLTDQITNAVVNGIYFSDSKHGWVLTSSTSSAQLQYTTDGGSSWTTAFTNAGSLSGMSFYGATLRGVVTGGGSGKLDIYYTKNGYDWTKAEAPEMPPVYTKTDIKSVLMVDSLKVHACGWGSLIGAQPSIHLKSINGGVTWTYMEQAEENLTYENLYDMYFKDTVNGLAIGGALGGLVVRTTDGGVNWVPVNNPAGPSLTRIYGNGDNLMVGGETGVILTSSDFGDNWLLKGVVPLTTLNTVQAVSENVIYTAGHNAVVIKSTDSGNTWETNYAKAGNIATNIMGLYFLNENIGYAGHTYGMVSKTTDGGATWSQSIPDTSSASIVYNDLYFLDENNGYAVGKWAANMDVIQKTTNGGQTWEKITGVTKTTLKSVSFSDAEHGIVVGEKLSSAYTTDGGANWNKSAFNDVPALPQPQNINRVHFTGGLNAVAIGYKLFLHTSDGGANWNYISNVDSSVTNLVGLAFKDSLNGWALASTPLSGVSLGIYMTKNGGQSWLYGKDTTDLSSKTVRNNLSVTPSGKLFAVTNATGIFALVTADTSIGISEDDFEMPGTYNLAQNYPNPFNPETNIRFTLPAQSRVTLKVYDILGKEVAELANETMNAGTHSVRFSSQNYHLSSGVYFYVLRADNFMQTKKMVLLK